MRKSLSMIFLLWFSMNNLHSQGYQQLVDTDVCSADEVERTYRHYNIK